MANRKEDLPAKPGDKAGGWSKRKERERGARETCPTGPLLTWPLLRPPPLPQGGMGTLWPGTEASSPAYVHRLREGWRPKSSPRWPCHPALCGGSACPCPQGPATAPALAPYPLSPPASSTPSSCTCPLHRQALVTWKAAVCPCTEFLPLQGKWQGRL